LSGGARLLLGACGAAGLWAAVTMTGAYYGWWRGPRRLVPARLCSAKTGGCMDILAVRDARLLGPPNSSLGIVYYAAQLALAAIEPGPLGGALGAWVTALSWAVVGLSIYLAWSLLFRLRTACPLCFLSHALNLAIALVLTLARRP
jgi:uncharacterized membrane protein